MSNSIQNLNVEESFQEVVNDTENLSLEELLKFHSKSEEVGRRFNNFKAWWGEDRKKKKEEDAKYKEIDLSGSRYDTYGYREREERQMERDFNGEIEPLFPEDGS